MNKLIVEEAAGWLVEFRAGEVDASQRRAFDSWLRSSPEHVRAYLELTAAWERGADLQPAAQGNVEVLIAQAREGGTVVPLSASHRSDRAARRAGKPVSRILIAASVLLVCGIAGVFAWSQRAPGYATGIAEQRSIVLPDGSSVEMNAMTRLRVRFSESERTIELLSGQALFEVAHEAARPFVVRSGQANVRAVGTQFDVYRREGGTTVTVVEGRVAVQPVVSGGAPAAGPVLMSAGEQWTVNPTLSDKPRAADAGVAIAWTQRRLIFSATALREVAEEFNRYNTRRLIVEDPQIADLRINGVFSSTDPQALLRFLRDQAGVAVTETDKDIRVGRAP